MTDALAGPYNRDLLDDAYGRYKADPQSVDPTWRAFFAGMEFAGNGPSPSSAPGSGFRVPGSNEADLRLQTGVVRLVNWYRQAGHLQADVDPLRDAPPPPHPYLALENFGLSDADLDKVVDVSMYFGFDGPVTLRELLAALRDTYCRTLGVEYMHIDSLDVRAWLARRMEPVRNRPPVPHRRQYRILFTLHQAELFEKFLHTKYVGQKRFSLEGGETLIPVMDALVEKAPSLGGKELVIGMAHRGRLNVLANVLHKPFEEIFNEFEDNFLPDSFSGDGDVKYHLGFSADVATADGGKVHLSVAPNPSHLEVVSPVVEGRVRAKQRLHRDADRTAGIPVLIHGDAAFAGQGVVMETLNLMNLAGYKTGGTIHLVVNNQIGFTTNPRDSRSTQYCTDIAKFVQAPVFHVNAEDPEACVYAAELALAFRQEFHRDVVIDLVCYRKWGHNEGDEPAFTQPLEYKNIRGREPISKVYSRHLAEGPSAFTHEEVASIEREFAEQLKRAVADADAAAAEYRKQLDDALKAVKSGPPRKRGMEGFSGVWKGLTKEFTHAPVETGVKPEVLDRIADALGAFPDGFTPHEKLRPMLEKRRDNVKGRKAVDWGTAESLAYGSLVLEGTPVRLSGQDSRRGTFTHRHAVVVDSATGAPHYPLAGLSPDQAPFEVYDSSLSEMAVMGFEFGYAMDDPSSLVIWEAQFGDFANGAQVVIDQFLFSCESKWNRSNGLVLLLPHAYEGQGPEHSSARLERYLQMCAEDNVQVCYPTTPAQIFHLLRRQVRRNFRKPLVVMTPKSLLRLPAATSPVEEFTLGGFREVIDDAGADPALVTRVLVCSGKVYYDLAAKKEKLGTKAVALVRLEQLYPWPEAQLRAVFNRYRRTREWVWVQEESQNMGGWSFAEPRLRAMNFPFEYVGRDASASPATGSHHAHEVEQHELVEAAFGPSVPHLVALSKSAVNARNGANGTGHATKDAAKKTDAAAGVRIRVSVGASARRCGSTTVGLTPRRSPVPGAAMAVEPVKVPRAGESIAEATVNRWLAADGAYVTVDQPLFELGTDKATQEVAAQVAGVLKHLAKEGDVVAVDAVVAQIDTAAKAPTAPASPGREPGGAKSAPQAPPKNLGADAPRSPEPKPEPGPAATRVLAEAGLKAGDVAGTGPGGRVTKGDALSASASGGRQPPETNGARAVTEPAPTPRPDGRGSPGGRVTRKPLSPVRKRIAQRLLESQNQTATLTTFNEADMTAIQELRAKYNERFEKKHGVKLGFMSVFVRAAVEALKAFPLVNARLDGDHVVEQHFYDIGVAVSTEKGLMVPVVRAADTLGFADIEKRIAELAKKARDGKIGVPDLEGGTFTITNGGTFGSMMSTPILNPPQVAILGMHSIQKRPVVVNDQIVIRPMMYLALSYDHRLIDGREAVQFLVRVKECVENPERMLLEV